MPQANNNPCPKNVLSAHPQAKISGEHVWSEWMALFPGPKTYLDIMRRRNWVSSHLNWKAKVVCITCNNGWMIRPISHTENLVARCKRDLGRLIDKRTEVRLLLLEFLDAPVIFRRIFHQLTARHDLRARLDIRLGGLDSAIWAPGRLARRSDRYRDATVRRERSHFALGFAVRAVNPQIFSHGSKPAVLCNSSCKPMFRQGQKLIASYPEVNCNLLKTEAGSRPVAHSFHIWNHVI